MKDYTLLGNAIVAQAADDYRDALRKVASGYVPREKEVDPKDEIERLEKFFYSDWYSVLTKVDPNYLIENLRKEVSCVA